MYSVTSSLAGSRSESAMNRARLYHIAAWGMSLANTYASPRLAHTSGILCLQSLSISFSYAFSNAFIAFSGL